LLFHNESLGEEQRRTGPGGVREGSGGNWIKRVVEPRVFVPVRTQGIDSCSGVYTVTSGEMLGVKPSGGEGGFFPTSASVMHFLHPVGATVLGGVVAAALF
jgi:hypothetical protein